MTEPENALAVMLPAGAVMGAGQRFPRSAVASCNMRATENQGIIEANPGPGVQKPEQSANNRTRNSTPWQEPPPYPGSLCDYNGRMNRMKSRGQKGL